MSGRYVIFDNNDLCYNIPGNNINIVIKELENIVTNENYKKITVIYIGSNSSINQYIFNEDASELILKTDLIDVIGRISTPKIHEKLFKVTTNTNNKEYLLITGDKIIHVQLDKILEHIKLQDVLNIKIYDIEKKLTYKFNQNIQNFANINDSKDVLPIDQNIFKNKYKFVIYYPKNNDEPFNIITAESDIIYSNLTTLNEKDDMNNICLNNNNIELVELLIKKNNIDNFYKTMIIKNNKIIGLFDEEGMFYCGKLYASKDCLKPVYKNICDKIKTYQKLYYDY